MIKKIKKIRNYLMVKSLPIFVSGNKPDFLIAGAQKAGTSSLYFYLSQHPELVGSTPKELHFFDREANYRKGIQWYHKHFFDKDNFFKKGLYFEATPIYMFKEGMAERIHAYNPNLKIIMILREPVKRAYSGWNMYTVKVDKNKKIKDKEFLEELAVWDNKIPSFEESVEIELNQIKSNAPNQGSGVIRRGIYLPQIKKYHELFGKENVLILGFKDLIEDKKKTLNSILQFLGIAESDWHFLVDEVRNSGSYSEKINETTKQKLDEFYEPYNKELFEYLGYKLNW